MKRCLFCFCIVAFVIINLYSHFNDKNSADIYSINSKEYKNIVDDVSKKAFEKSVEFCNYSISYVRVPYIEIWISSKEHLDYDAVKEKSTVVLKDFLNGMQKYKFKKGKGLAPNWEYINIYYSSNNKKITLAQIDVLKIDRLSINTIMELD